MQDTTIRHILEGKGNDIWSIGPKASVYDALSMMSSKNIGALIVMNQGKMVGIISERDYARKVILLGKTSRETQVDEIMSRTVFTIHPDQTIEEAMEMMNNHHIRHLPVEENHRVIGMITVRDVMKVIIFNQLQEIKILETKLVAMWQH